MEKIRLDGKHVGDVDGKTYITYRKHDRHYHRKIGGYGLSVSLFDMLKGKGIETVKIVETKDGRMREMEYPLHYWKAIGKEVQFRNYDLQLILPLDAADKMKSVKSILDY
jgi:hypothetical protein